MRLGVAPRPLIDTQMAFTLGARDHGGGRPRRLRDPGGRAGDGGRGRRAAGNGPARDGEAALRPGHLRLPARPQRALRAHEGGAQVAAVLQPDRPHRQAALPAQGMGVDGPDGGVRAHGPAARHPPRRRQRGLGLLPAGNARDGRVVLRRGGPAAARPQGRAGPARHRRVPRLLLRRSVPSLRGPARGRARPPRGGREGGAAAGRRGHGRPSRAPRRGRPERRPGGGGLGRRDDRPGRSPLQRGAEPRARRPRGARTASRRRLRHPRRLPAPAPGRRRPAPVAPGVLLRADQPVRDLDARGDGRLAARRRARAQTRDPPAHRPRRGHPGGGQARRQRRQLSLSDRAFNARPGP